MYHTPRWTVTTSVVGIKRMITYAKISPKMVNPRDVAGNAEEEEERESDGLNCG